MKKFYKVTFSNEQHETMQIYATQVGSSDMLGFIEVCELVFIDSSDLIINPEDDKIKKMFKDTKRVFFPINSILRIEEVLLERGTPILKLIAETNEATTK